MDLIEPLMRLCNYALTNSSIHASWWEASIIVLPKDNKDKMNAESYRLIWLLNFDLKIFTKTLANCLNIIIQGYIKSDQTGFIPNRALTDNIQKSINLIWCCRKEKILSILLSADICKAFDSTEFTYLQTLMEEMGFGSQFLNGI